jgi:hypothetical protein
MKMINYLTIIVTVVCVTYISVILTACDDSDSEKKGNETVVQGDNHKADCEELVPRLAECYDLADWGIESVESGQAECKSGSPDSYDLCLFNCNSYSVDCTSFVSCVDDCG